MRGVGATGILTAHLHHSGEILIRGDGDGSGKSVQGVWVSEGMRGASGGGLSSLLWTVVVASAKLSQVREPNHAIGSDGIEGGSRVGFSQLWLAHHPILS